MACLLGLCNFLCYHCDCICPNTQQGSAVCRHGAGCKAFSQRWFWTFFHKSGIILQNVRQCSSCRILPHIIEVSANHICWALSPKNCDKFFRYFHSLISKQVTTFLCKTLLSPPPPSKKKNPHDKAAYICVCVILKLVFLDSRIHNYSLPYLWVSGSHGSWSLWVPEHSEWVRHWRF